MNNITITQSPNETCIEIVYTDVDGLAYNKRLVPITTVSELRHEDDDSRIMLVLVRGEEICFKWDCITTIDGNTVADNNELYDELKTLIDTQLNSLFTINSLL